MSAPMITRRLMVVTASPAATETACGAPAAIGVTPCGAHLSGIYVRCADPTLIATALHGLDGVHGVFGTGASDEPNRPETNR